MKRKRVEFKAKVEFDSFIFVKCEEDGSVEERLLLRTISGILPKGAKIIDIERKRETEVPNKNIPLPTTRVGINMTSDPDDGDDEW